MAQLASGPADSSPTVLETIRVIGGSEEDLVLPTAPQKVSKEKMETFKFTDVNRALKQSSGVYVREEDGQGLRPNIGLRGTNPDRSKKITLLEDGILIGPAPYSAPAAYYTPLMNRIESLEVYKGFSAVPFGPNSVGGAINYVSRGIPERLAPEIDASFGSFDTRNLKTAIGQPTVWGGYSIHASRLETSGFKRLDGGGANTGFLVHDVAGRFRFDLPRSMSRQHQLELRVGYADQRSNETYLGLSASDFSESPYRRYSASALDQMNWQHAKFQAEHSYQLTDSGLLTTTAYRHDFNRVWYRLDRFRGGAFSLQDILKDPTGQREIRYDILRGATDSTALGATNGQLGIANNDRIYDSQGLQTRYSDSLTLAGLRHDVEIMARLHTDTIRRNHGLDYYEMTLGRLERTADARQTDRLNRDNASARTISFQDNIGWNRWVFTFAGRYENVDFTHTDDLQALTRSRNDSVFVPGAGALYQLTDRLSLRGSLNQAATLAGLDSLGREAREESTNYELGLKYFSRETQRLADVVWFFNDYRNLTGTCTTSAGCTSQQLDEQFNGGRAHIQGIEARIAQGFSLGPVWIPTQVNVTWIQTSFQSEFVSENPEWGVDQIRIGDPLPYVPTLQYSLLLGTEYRRFKQELALIYQGKMYDQSAALGRLEVPAYGILDWSGRYALSPSASVHAKIDNLLGRDYIAALRPFGYRPGKPQSFMVGASYAF
jgi:Fe(3+) dicitrate transport protein